MAQHHLKNSTYKVNEIFQAAITEAVNTQSRILLAEFVLMALVEQKDSVVFRMAKECKIDEVAAKTSIVNALYHSISIRQAKKETPYRAQGPSENLYGSQELQFLLDRADAERKNFGDAYISTGTLYLAFFDPRLTDLREILERAGFGYEDSRRALLAVRGTHRIANRDDESKQSVLEQYTKDLTEMARRGELDPVSCRDEEMERVIQILSRRKKNNPVLIGEPGVGKTVIIEGLAQRIVAQEVPEHLVGKRLLSLEMADIVAGAKMHGEFEERLKTLKEEIIAEEGQVILFIDEIHTVVGAGRTAGVLDASNILKSALAKGQLQCIGATTFKEYKHYIESDRALERRFQPIKVEEPNLENAKTMVRDLAEKYEKHHQIRYASEALEEAVELGNRYIFERHLPDKAIDLIDEAGALKRIKVVSLPPEIRKLELEKVTAQDMRSDFFNKQDFARVAEIQMKILELEKRISEKKKAWEATIRDEDRIVSAEDIAEIVSKQTGIPLQRLRSEDLDKLAHIEEALQSRVVGQNVAVTAVANALRRNRVGLRERKAPIGSFLFLGPTGVGKTELAKALAEYVLNDESRIIRFDMSEFMERHETAKLIGSPPGYVGYGEGGQLTERVRRQPYSVILLDEVEKAHPDVFNMFLQILDDGRLADAEGQVVNFENTLIVFTSNIGSEYISQNRRTVGLSSGEKSLTDAEVETLVNDELKKFFKPEFLNRLDEIIVFHKLTMEEFEKIYEIQSKKLSEKLLRLGLKIEMSSDAKQWLMSKGFDPVYGARPLRRVLEHDLENLIAHEIVRVGKNKETKLVNGTQLTVQLNASNTLEVHIR